MAIMTTAAPSERPMTVAELDALPDDGRRRELVDGVLIVSPSPSRQHQRAAANLFRLLDRAMTEHDDLELLFAPLDVRTSPTTNLQPDLLIAPRRDFTDAHLPVAPLLAVEVLSPSTRHVDLGLKRNAYETLGTSSYWVVDPMAPSVVAWDLEAGTYVEAGRAVADDELDLTRPFPVRVVPADLTRR